METIQEMCVGKVIELDKYDVKINSVRWGSTPLNELRRE